MLVNFLLFVYFLYFALVSISNFIPMWSKNIQIDICLLLLSLFVLIRFLCIILISFSFTMLSSVKLLLRGFGLIIRAVF